MRTTMITTHAATATATDLDETIATTMNELLNVSGRRFGRITTGKSIWSYNPAEDYTIKSRIVKKRSKSCKPTISTRVRPSQNKQQASLTTTQLFLNHNHNRKVRNRFLDIDDDYKEEINNYHHDQHHSAAFRRAATTVVTSTTAEINSNNSNKSQVIAAASNSTTNATNNSKLFFSNLFLSQLCGGCSSSNNTQATAAAASTSNLLTACSKGQPPFVELQHRRRKQSRSFSSNIKRQLIPSFYLVRINFFYFTFIEKL